MPFTVEIHHPDRPPEILSFEQPVVTVGRDQGDVTVADPQLSGRHAELRFDGEALQFSDLTSTNGSFDQEGQRLEVPTQILPGQRVQIGDTWIEVKSITAGPPPASETAASPRLMLHVKELRCIKQQEIGGDE